MSKSVKHASGLYKVNPTIEKLKDSLVTLQLRFQDLRDLAEMCEREFNEAVELLETLEEKEDERSSA